MRAVGWLVLGVIGAGLAAPAQMPIPRPPPPVELAAVLHRSVFWSQDPATTRAQLAGVGFQWTSGGQTSMRAAHAGLRYLDFPVIEAVVWLERERPREVFLSLYNRGDCRPVSEAEFGEFLITLAQALSRATQVKPMIRDPMIRKGFPSRNQTWKTPGYNLTMEWDFSLRRQEGSDFVAEYLRLRLQPPGALAISTREAEVSSLALTRKAVSRTDTGFVFLDGVPMVDQGPRGYCAVAAVERVLRYYGATYDQFQLAQVSDTTWGTDPESLMKALKKLSVTLRIKVETMEDFDVKELRRRVAAYNAVARRAKAREVFWPEGGPIDVNRIYQSFDPTLYLASRTQNPAGLNKFKQTLVARINSRVPLLWGVMLGVYPEPGLPQAWGGHLRLLIGYNERTREVMYSDSWGAGHDRKRMPMDQAYAITVGLYAISPK